MMFHDVCLSQDEKLLISNGSKLVEPWQLDQFLLATGLSGSSNTAWV
jgi:hypothetical protein